MAFPEFMQSIVDRLESSASVKRVYGDPITVDGRTVIPVARIGYGFGGGAGSRNPREEKPEKSGSGGGGGAGAVPVGVVEVTAEGTRYIAFMDKRKMAAVLAAGFVLGLLAGRRG